MAIEKTMAQKLAEIEAENVALKAKLASRQHLSLKVSEKGAVSLYGVRRFPVTFYRSEWERIINHVPAVQAFIEANRASLSEKSEKEAE